MMTHKQRRPAWWMLYAFVLVMGGLLLLESRAALSPGGHKAVQIGIILFVYGLVWVWIWANDVALRHDDRQVLGQDDERHAPETDDRATSWALDPDFRPSQIYGSGVRLHTTGRCTNIRSNGREIRKCSRNLDRLLRRWRS
jgi:hypothetical protein